MFVIVMMIGLIVLVFSVMMMIMSSYSGVWIVSMKVLSSLLGYDFELLFSTWNLFFMLMVLMITLAVSFFSFSYMSVYPIKSFYYLYMAFVFSMCWLILNSNFYWMMLGWDGLGVVSFLLIFFYQNYESSSNALFTLFQNRVGDLFFVLFLVMSSMYSMSMSLWVSSGLLVLLIGSVVKSAQYPFNAWLLSAMSAPTPISSLVHSSTLVVAGVYILLQYSYCLTEYLSVIKFMSLSTLVVSLFGLMMESDMKKLIANSTMSHVGLMLLLLSNGLYKITFFHLNIHAMFKSMMFMCFGFVMLISVHSQDYRLISFSNLNPVLKFCYLYSCLCLMGLPFLSAFFSKDFIMEKWIEFSLELSFVFMMVMFLAVSIFYSMKLFSLKDSFFSWGSKEEFKVGMWSVIMMIFVSVIYVNVFISYVFSVSLELVSLKFLIYLVIMIFFFIWALSKFFFKWYTFEKIVFFKEVFSVYWYQIEVYGYSVMYEVIFKMASLMSLKYTLVVNWWVLVILLILF